MSIWELALFAYTFNFFFRFNLNHLFHSVHWIYLFLCFIWSGKYFRNYCVYFCFVKTLVFYSLRNNIFFFSVPLSTSFCVSFMKMLVEYFLIWFFYWAQTKWFLFGRITKSLSNTVFENRWIEFVRIYCLFFFFLFRVKKLWKLNLHIFAKQQVRKGISSKLSWIQVKWATEYRNIIRCIERKKNFKKKFEQKFTS